MLAVGRATSPIVVDASPVAPDDPDGLLVQAPADAAGLHRMWTAALFHRALDGYDAALVLWEARVDTEARAHCRIAFEHLISFAWIGP